MRSVLVIGDQEYRLRECVHRRRGVDGEFYDGVTYLDHLQRLRSDTAVRVAANVTPFFWSDAAQVMVWLCHACAVELRLRRHEAA